MWILDFLFPNRRGTADPRGPHDRRGDETVDPKTGIAEVDGQILDTTEIDPEIQDKKKGFPGGTL